MRTNLASVVAEGAVKPTSTYTLVRVEDKLDVVAHLSEAVPRFWIADNVALEQFLTNEMTYGLALAVEALIVSDVAGTNGVQTQAYATSPLVTLRKSLTKLETTGYVPSAIAVNPTDFEAVELALATTTAPRTHELAVRCCGPQVVGHTSGGDQRRRRRCGVHARAGCSRIDDRSAGRASRVE